MGRLLENLQHTYIALSYWSSYVNFFKVPFQPLKHVCVTKFSSFSATEARRAADETFTMRASAGVNPAHRNVVLAMQPGSLGAIHRIPS